jgi:hypothetical protein
VVAVCLQVHQEAEAGDSGFFTVFRMNPQVQHDYCEKFKSLFSKIDYNAGKEISDFLNPDELEVYQVICLSCDEEVLKKAIEALLREKQKMVKKDSKKAGSAGVVPRT